MMTTSKSFRKILFPSVASKGDFRSASGPVITLVFLSCVIFIFLSFCGPTAVQGYDIDSVCDICSFYAGDLAPGKILKKMMRLFCQNREIHYIDHNLRDACKCKNYYY